MKQLFPLPSCSPRRPAVRRMAPLLLGLAALAAWAPPLAQAEPSTLYRLYYSPVYQGVTAKSPADPSGSFSGAIGHSTKGELEAIFFRRIGLSFGRQPYSRSFSGAGGASVKENAVLLSANLTAYLAASQHNGWNLFGGVGQGLVENYEYQVNGIRLDQAELHAKIPLRRTFLGVEYTFERIGVRLETSRVEAAHTVGGQSAELSQSFQHLTFFIPFN